MHVEEERRQRVLYYARVQPHIATNAAAASHLQSKSRVTGTRLGEGRHLQRSALFHFQRARGIQRVRTQFARLQCRRGTRLPMCKPNLLKTEQT